MGNSLEREEWRRDEIAKRRGSETIPDGVDSDDTTATTLGNTSPGNQPRTGPPE